HHALTAAIIGATPNSRRVKLSASTCNAISLPTLGSVFIKKCVAPIRIFIVPKGCSTVSRRVRIASGFLSSLACTASTTSSCSHRVIRRCGPMNPARHSDPPIQQENHSSERLFSRVRERLSTLEFQVIFGLLRDRKQAEAVRYSR